MHAVFNDFERQKALRRLLMPLGLSVVVSELFDKAEACCKSRGFNTTVLSIHWASGE